MPEPAYTLVGTADNLQSLSVDASARGPVPVNDWSPGADPCMMPMLDQRAWRHRARLLECLDSGLDSGRKTT